jgi:uncharacterized membrane protein
LLPLEFFVTLPATPPGLSWRILVNVSAPATEEDISMAFCNMCGAQIADGATTCAACAGKTATAPPPASAGGMADNVAGMLAYITIIPAIIFLVMEPYNKSRFVRFHSFQNLFFAGGLVVCWIAFVILSMVLTFIPILGHIVMFLLWMVLSIGSFVVWIIMLLKANGGQMWKLPVIGDMAEKQANAM